MLIVMRHNASSDQVDRVVDEIRTMGYDARAIEGRQRTAVGLIGNDGRVDSARIGELGSMDIASLIA